VIAGVQLPGPIQLGREPQPAVPHGPAGAHARDEPRRPQFRVAALGLDVPWAIDPSDKDALQVYPNPPQANVLQAMESLGFRLYKVDIDARSSWFGRKWVQEFEFKPAGYGRARYDEVEVVFEGQRGDQLDLMLQLDRSARGFGGFLMEMSGTDESWHRVTVDGSSAQAAAASLSRVIGEDKLMTAAILPFGGRRNTPFLDPIMSLVAGDLNHVNAGHPERMQSEWC
jgi:hypothetical protein